MLAAIWKYSDTLAPLVVLLLLLPCRQMDSKRILLTYLLATVVLMGYSNYLADRGRVNTHLYHGYTLLEAWLLVPLLMRQGKRNSRLMWALLLVFTLFWIADIAWLEALHEFNSYTATVLALLVSFCCFRYFLYLIKTDQILYFQQQPSFYIASGLLFYCMVSILVISNYKNDGSLRTEDLRLIWNITQTAGIIKYLLWAIGILCCYKQARRPGSSL